MKAADWDSLVREVLKHSPTIHAAVSVAAIFVKSTAGHCSVTQTKDQFYNKHNKTCFPPFFLFISVS
jgi:hypothetical protein